MLTCRRALARHRYSTAYWQQLELLRNQARSLTVTLGSAPVVNAAQLRFDHPWNQTTIIVRYHTAQLQFITLAEHSWIAYCSDRALDRSALNQLQRIALSAELVLECRQNPWSPRYWWVLSGVGEVEFHPEEMVLLANWSALNAKN
jgi:hypothetical protein